MRKIRIETDHRDKRKTAGIPDMPE